MLWVSIPGLSQIHPYIFPNVCHRTVFCFWFLFFALLRNRWKAAKRIAKKEKQETKEKPKRSLPRTGHRENQPNQMMDRPNSHHPTLPPEVSCCVVPLFFFLTTFWSLWLPSTTKPIPGGLGTNFV